MTNPNGSPVCISCATEIDANGIAQIRADTVIRELRMISDALKENLAAADVIACQIHQLADAIEAITEGLIATTT